ncbi:MAG: TIGR04255 family protein [Pirellulaceae bacterium]
MPDDPARFELPEYENPPVVETILGIQFDRMPSFQNAHLGAFWKTLDSAKWPVVKDAPPLPTRFERFEETARWAKAIHLELTQDPTCRLQIRNHDGDRMIQLQNGRIHFNWLGQTGSNYPRYNIIRNEFEVVLEKLVKFINQEQIGRFQPNQWEVTYVNHIPAGTVWNGPNDWTFCRLLCPLPSVDNLFEGESFNGEWHFRIPEERGRLYVTWQLAQQMDVQERDDGFVRLSLTARGPVGNSTDDVQVVFEEGLEVGRSIIVKTFKALMSDEANQFWGLKNA